MGLEGVSVSKWDICDEHRTLNAAMAALLLVVGALPFWVGPSELARLGISCELKALCGVACPTCGLTRAISALYDAQLLRSVHINPRGLLWFGAFVIQLLLRAPVHVLCSRSRWVPWIDLMQLALTVVALRVSL